MRIRKKESKRTSTRMREGIKKKALAQNRKNRKMAKKDVTWKSRTKKDPGIPAMFPYKHKILEDIEVKRTQDANLKEQQRLEKIEKKKLAAENGELVSDDEEMDEDEEGDGMAALLESAQRAAEDYEGSNTKSSAKPKSTVEYQDYDLESDSEDEDEVSELHQDLEKSRKQYDKIFKVVLENSDLLLYVLDARDPDLTRSKALEESILTQFNGTKKLIYILNKVDLIPESVLKIWMTHLGSQFPVVPFMGSASHSNNGRYNKKLSSSATSNKLLESLKKYATDSNLKRSITVGVLGYPNVGKSSIINALTNTRGPNNSVCTVGNQAGVTTHLREVKIDNKLKILDSPGIVFPNEVRGKNIKEKNLELSILNCIPTKFIKEPELIVKKLLTKISNNDDQVAIFKEYYELPPIPTADLEMFTKHFLIHLSRKRGRIGKGGVPNFHSTAVSVLNDWRDGKILSWSLPKNIKTQQDAILDQQKTLQGKKQPETSVGASTVVVQQFAQEFDLDSLFADLDNAISGQK
ncbi:hypothetical protein QEN19_004110 [Hanseniaspora menglaensis]